MAAADDTGVKTDLKVSSQPSSLKDVSTGGAELASTAPLPTYEHEKKLVLKFDLCILPVLAFMYLCNSLDKGKIPKPLTKLSLTPSRKPWQRKDRWYGKGPPLQDQPVQPHP